MAVIRRKDDNNRVLKDNEYQRKNGTYEYKWTDKTGKRHSIYAKTLQGLRVKEGKVQNDIFDGIRPEYKKYTLNDAYEKWKMVKRGLQDNTFRNYVYMYEQYVKEKIGRWKLEDIKKSDIRAFYNNLNESLHLRTNTIDNIHTVLHQVLDLAVEDELIRTNPSDKALIELKRAVKDNVKKNALTTEQQTVFLKYLKETPKYQHWYPFFCVMLWTGMRIGECSGLRWCDIDFDNGTIDVNHTVFYFDKATNGRGQCGFVVHSSAKTEAGNRTVPMLPMVREALLMERDYQAETSLHSQFEQGEYRDFVFFNKNGMPHHQGTINKALKRIVRDYNLMAQDNGLDLLPLFTSHTLRHSFATRLNEADVNIKTRQNVLGHKDIQTTLNIYTDASEDLNKKELQKLLTTGYDKLTTENGKI